MAEHSFLLANGLTSLAGEESSKPQCSNEREDGRGAARRVERSTKPPTGGDSRGLRNMTQNIVRPPTLVENSEKRALKKKRLCYFRPCTKCSSHVCEVRNPWHGYLKTSLYRASLLVTRSYWGVLALLLGARTLLGAPGLTTRSKDATRGSWHRY